MTIGRLHRLSVLGAAILGALGVSTGSPLLESSAWTAIALLALAYRGFDEGRRPWWLTLMVHGLTIAVLVFCVRLYPSDKVDAVLVLLMAGIINRAVLRGGVRDDFLIVGTSSVLFAAATIVTPGLGFLALLVAYLPCVVFALWTSTYVASIEAGEADRSRLTDSAPPQLMRFAGLLMVFTVVGFATFSLFPRYRFLPNLGVGAFVRVPGASDTMQLDSGSLSPRRDKTVVARVTMPSDATIEGLYLRVYALEKFDGQTFSRTAHGVVKVAKADSLVSPDARSARVVYIPTRNGRTRETVLPVVGRGTLGFPIEKALHADFSGTWRLSRRASSRLDYRVAFDRKSPGMLWPNGIDRQSAFVALPDGLDPRIAALARSLVQGPKTDREKMGAILRHFNGGFRYTLNAPTKGDPDPLVRFVFDTQAGHCELYAAAVAVLLRSAGIPSRVATGYYGGSPNVLGNFVTFTQEDAHAWVEAEIDGQWVWVDATPPGLRQPRVGRGMLAFVEELFEVVDAAWYNYVVDYDSASARDVFRSAGVQLQEYREELRQLEPTPERLRTLVGLGLLALSVLALLLWVLARRRNRLEVLGQRLRRALAAASEQRAEELAPLTLDALVRGVRTELQDEATLAVAVYQAVRFGPAEQGPEVQAAVERLETQNRAAK